jgi:type II secretory ATPase GspE/PulE/Tfp pilus assembly ATPase PilB-like protein
MIATTKTASLPIVTLKNTQVPFAVLSIIPLETMERYQIAAFQVEKDVLKLAIVYPEQLKQGFLTALSDIGKKIGREVKIYQTDSASLHSLISQYRSASTSKTTVPSDTVQPPLFRVGKTVAFNYLKRVPLGFAKLHRILCVDHIAPNVYWFAVDGSQANLNDVVIPFIEKQNKIVAHTLTISKGDFDDLLQYYSQLLDEEERSVREKANEDKPNPIADAKPPVPIAVKAEAQPAKESPTAEELGEVIVSPDIKGEIITTENERGGLAGLFQKVAQNFGQKAGEHSDSLTQPVPELPQARVVESRQVPVPTASPTPVGIPAVAIPGALPSISAATTSANPAEEPAAIPAVSLVPPAVVAPVPTPTPAATTKPDIDGDLGKALSKPVESVEELREHVRQGSVPVIVAAVVNFAIHEKASDIHVESFEDEVRVRYRVDGQLLDVVKLPPDIHAAMVSRIKILARLRLDETRVPQDGRFDVNFANAQVDLRVSIMPTVHGEKVVMRILDKSKGAQPLENLGIKGLAYENLTKAINRPFGICLATGPTGSGKSTSLYAILTRIATPNVNVITLEDPVEFEMKGINQSQIRPKIGFTFAEGLRAILRQDPNIIMVGEIRDGETANMATQAALTGHLVLSTLHTNDAAGAIPRLSNMGIEPFLITSSLNVAMGQRLVRKICGECKSVVNLPDGIKDQIKKDVEAIAALSPLDAKRIKEPYTFYQGTGCAVCSGKGYQGRVGIYEVMSMSPALEELTIKRASGSEIKEVAQKEGMITMYQDGLLKVLEGLTTLDEVLRETSNK